MNSLQTAEEISAKGATAPRVSVPSMEARVVEKHFFTVGEALDAGGLPAARAAVDWPARLGRRHGGGLMHDSVKAPMIEKVLVTLDGMTDAEGRVLFLNDDVKIEVLRDAISAVENMRGDAAALGERFQS